MNYLLEDIFRRADTWRGMDQHGMDPSGLGQQQRVFLHPENTAANGDAHTSEAASDGARRDMRTPPGPMSRRNVLQSGSYHRAVQVWKRKGEPVRNPRRPRAL